MSIMKAKNRELLNRASGVLYGLAVNLDITTGLADTIINVAEWLDTVLKDEEAPE